jgi:hypothetical protein
MQQGLKEFNTAEMSTCLSCCVGFPLDKNDHYCGFCGQKTKALSVEVSPDFPIYMDQQGPVKVTLKIKNIGLTTCSINTENFVVKCQ